MTKNKISVLELNNLDILGRRFNGYDLTEYISQNYNNININMLVNHQSTGKTLAKNIFRPRFLGEFDWIVASNERKYLSVKNQLSITEEALIRHPLYRSADILHFHQYHNMNLPIEFLGRIDPNKKIILELHDTFWLTDKKIPMLEVFDYAGDNTDSLNKQRKRILENTDIEIIVHSPYMFNLLKSSTTTKNLKNIHLINFGIDTKTFKPLKNCAQIRKKFKIEPSNIVLFCRAQKEFKGVDYIIEALKKIDKSLPLTIITVANKGEFECLKNRFQIIDFGIVEDEHALAELYNACDIFLSPSTEESFGFMAAEAMACGKPVVVFDGTALPFTTGAPDIGISVKRNASALRGAILDLINNEDERLRRGADGIEFVRKNYSLKKYFQDYVDLFKKLSNSKPRIVTNGVVGRSGSTDIEDLTKTLKVASHDSIYTKNACKKYTPPIVNYNSKEAQELILKTNREMYNKIKKRLPTITMLKIKQKACITPVGQAISKTKRIVRNKLK